MQKEQLIYAGVPTFMGGDLIEARSIKKYDVVFLGVPTDYGSGYRLGSKYAPRKLRELSFWDRVDGASMYNLDNGETVESNYLDIADIGDIDVDPTHPDKNQNNITKSVYQIRRNAFPLVCGGDHAITYGSFRGCYKYMKELYPDYELGIIHFDAHMDTFGEYLNMPKVWHGNTFERLIEDGYLKGENLYTIGPRGYLYSDWMDYSKSKNINIYTANNIKEQGIESILKEIKEKNKNKKIKFYVTFDIDFIDPSYVLGTGTPVMNGPSAMVADDAVQLLKDFELVGFDIVELNPTLDNSHTSFIIACDLLYHFLAFGFNKEKNKLIKYCNINK